MSDIRYERRHANDYTETTQLEFDFDGVPVDDSIEVNLETPTSTELKIGVADNGFNFGDSMG